MLIETWSNHEQPIVHANLDPANIMSYVSTQIDSFKSQGIYKSQTTGNADTFQITLTNGVTVTYEIAIVR